MQIFEALQTRILKRASSYRNGHISPGMEAARHINGFIQGLEEQEEAEIDI